MLRPMYVPKVTRVLRELDVYTVVIILTVNLDNALECPFTNITGE